MKSPTVYKLSDLARLCRTDNGTTVKIGHTWHPARPIGLQSVRYRLWAAWLVFTGRADAVIWPGGQ